MSCLTNQQTTVALRKIFTRLHTLSCLIKKLENEPNIVNIDFRVTDGVLEYSTDGGVTWNTGPDFSDDFVTIAGDPQIVTSEKTFASNVNVGGNVLPTTTASQSLGSASLNFLSAYIRNIFSNSNFTLGVANTGDITIYNSNSQNSSQIIGGFFNLSRNLYLQASGAKPTDLGHRLQIYGTQYISGYTDNAIITASPTTSYSITIAPITKLNLTGNLNITFPNHASNLSTTLKLELIQDATSGRLVTWNNVRFPGGIPPVLSSSANARDILEFWWDGTYWMLTNFVPDLR